MVFIATFDNN